MKKSLLALLMASLMLLGTACFDSGDTDTTGTDESTDTSADIPDDSDTTAPADSDSDLPDSTDTEVPVDSDTQEPEKNVFYSNDLYTVTILEDGTFNYFRRSETDGDINAMFHEAFVLEYEDYYGTACESLALIYNNEYDSVLYTPDSVGNLKKLYTASKFIKLGNYILANTRQYQYDQIYCPDLVGYANVGFPYYVTNREIVSTEYIENTNSFCWLSSLDGNFVKYEFYPEPQMLDALPDGAVLIDELANTTYTMKLYETSDAYYCSYDYLIVKLPIDKSYTYDNVTLQLCPRFYKISGDEIEFTEFKWLFTQGNTTPELLGILKREFSPCPDCILEYMGANVVHTEPYMYIFKDGEMLHILDAPELASVEIVGDYLTCVKGGVTYNTVILPNLTILGGTRFEEVAILSDDNCMVKDIEGFGYSIYSPDGNVVYTSPTEQKVWQIGAKIRNYSSDGTYSERGAEYALVIENGHLKLYEPYGTFLCDFGEIPSGWVMHEMLSGYYTKEGYPTGVYFVFEDSNDRTDDGGSRSYEYYYSFETGEHGLIDNGYSSFAYAKPVLYLYPTEVTDVTVTFEHPDRLTVDYPVYNDSWHVTASPDGTLTDANGREYYALYWEESSGTPYYSFIDGFCVKGEESASFLEEKLAVLGFTDKEANEFIIYWLPILEPSEYNLIRFELTNEREASNALHISPAPDSLLRVAMHVKALDAPLDIEKQELPSFERNGFTAVEWGGCIH